LELWSANPVLFSSTTSYDFSSLWWWCEPCDAWSFRW
jgi:hypothetical protein